MKSAHVAVFAAATLLIGCGDSVKVTPIRAKGKPSYVRVANLTGEPIHADIAVVYKDEIIEPMDVMSVRAVRPDRELSMAYGGADKGKTFTFKTAATKITTVVIDKKGASFFNSGDGISSQTGGKVEVVNLSDKPLDFQIGSSAKVNVKPRDSVSQEVALGSVTVSCAGKEADLDIGATQIFAVYAIQSGKKLELKVVSQKGTGGVVSSGGPSAQ